MQIGLNPGALGAAIDRPRAAEAFAGGSVSRRTVAWSVALTLAVAVGILSLNSFVPDGSIIRSDGLAYFMYARSIVVDHDTDLTAEYPAVMQRYANQPHLTTSLVIYGHRVPGTGKFVVPWPIGAGVLMAPFYAVGYGAEYAVASLQHRAPDDFGAIPQYAVALGSVLFGVLAFWTSFACCVRIGTVRAAYLGSLSALLASPAVFYIFFAPTMAHAISLGLVGLLTWMFLVSWQDGTQRVFLLGLLLGVLVAVRYQNVLFGLMVIALLARDTWRRGVAVGLRETAMVALGGAIPIAMQAAHYVAMNGLSLGYQADTGQGLVLLNHARIGLDASQFVGVMFSCNKGAFYWAPLMAIGVVGLLDAARRHAWATIMVAIFLANVVLISLLRWGNATALDMGVSFGMRYLTECCVLVAMGLAALASKARTRAVWQCSVAVAALFSVWNLALVLAYVMTIPRAGCVTYPEMAHGMGRAAVKVFALIAAHL
jgi:hypothetical protein